MTQYEIKVETERTKYIKALYIAFVRTGNFPVSHIKKQLVKELLKP